MKNTWDEHISIVGELYVRERENKNIHFLN